MTETMTGIRPIEVTPSSNKATKIKEFAASEEFGGLRHDLKHAAVERSVYFTEASDATVTQGLTVLYEGNKFGGFNQHEKETFGSLASLKESEGSLFDKKMEEGLSHHEAGKAVNTERRITVASRYARNDFAKVLGYHPGREGQPGEFDYAATIANPDFKLADRLVHEAVAKFS